MPRVTYIPADTFKNRTNLISASLSVVTNIPDGNSSYIPPVYISGVFYGCTGLTDVSLPAAISIGAAAFYGCTSLVSINLPAATDIGYQAFYDCTALTSMDL